MVDLIIITAASLAGMGVALALALPHHITLRASRRHSRLGQAQLGQAQLGHSQLGKPE